MSVEVALIGSLFSDDEVIHKVDTIVSHDDFENTHLGLIYKTYRELTNSRQTPDVFMIQDVLGGEYFSMVSDCIIETPSAVNAVYFAERVREKAQERKFKQTLANVLNDKERPLQQKIDSLQRDLLEIQTNTKVDNIRTLKSLGKEFIEEQELRRDLGGFVGLSTGFADLDERINGMRKGNFILIAGRPSMGKTTLAMNICEHNMLEGEKIYGVPLEMSGGELIDKSFASLGRVDYTSILNGTALKSVTESEKIVIAGTKINQFGDNFCINDKPAQTISEIRLGAKQAKAKMGGLSILMIDYIQLADAGEAKEFDNVTAISKALKAIAKELDCVVLGVAQLSRSLENRSDKRPIMSDLRSSGQIEQDGDAIIFVYRDEVYNPDTVAKGCAEAIVGKARKGKPGTVYLAANLHNQRFDNADHEIIELCRQSRESGKPSRKSMF